MTFDKSSKIFYDDLAGQSASFQSYFHAFGHDYADSLRSADQQNYYKAMWGNFLLYSTLKESSVYVLDSSLANEIMRSTVDEPTLDDFRRIPNRRLFINFLEPIPIPEIWKDAKVSAEVFESRPADNEETISGIQISWNTSKQVQELTEGHKLHTNLYLRDCCSVGIWRRNPVHRQFEKSGLPGKFPLHKAEQLARYESRNVVIDDINASNVKWDERGILPTAYRFLAFLSASNVDYKEIKRELKEDRKIPQAMRPVRKPALLPFIKTYTASVYPESQSQVIPNQNPRARHVVRGHGSKYWHCPLCKKITPHLEIAKNETCKHCASVVGVHSKWEKEWRWVPEHYRGTTEPTNVAHRYIVQG